MTTNDQAVYDASVTAAKRIGAEGAAEADLIPLVLDSPEVAAVLPKWGVGNLSPTLIADLRVAFLHGRDR